MSTRGSPASGDQTGVDLESVSSHVFTWPSVQTARSKLRWDCCQLPADKESGYVIGRTSHGYSFTVSTSMAWTTASRCIPYNGRAVSWHVGEVVRNDCVTSLLSLFTDAKLIPVSWWVSTWVNGALVYAYAQLPCASLLIILFPLATQRSSRWTGRSFHVKVGRQCTWRGLSFEPPA